MVLSVKGMMVMVMVMVTMCTAGELLRLERERQLAGFWIDRRHRVDLRHPSDAGDGGLERTPQRGELP